MLPYPVKRNFNMSIIDMSSTMSVLFIAFGISWYRRPLTYHLPDNCVPNAHNVVRNYGNNNDLCLYFVKHTERRV